MASLWHRGRRSDTANRVTDPRSPRVRSDVAALGLDETLMQRRGQFRARAWATSIVDDTSPHLPTPRSRMLGTA